MPLPDNQADSVSTVSQQSLSRRRLLRAAAIGVAGAPAIVSRSVLASSGELNLMLWTGSFPPGFIDRFSAEYGIKVNLISANSNDDMLTTMYKHRGKGIDLLSPTNTRANQWQPLGVLQAIDTRRVNRFGQLHSALRMSAQANWSFANKGTHWLPHVWGVEGIAWRNDMWAPGNPAPSFGDLWRRELRGKIMLQPHSGMLGAGLYLERIGELPTGAVRQAYTDERSARAVWSKVAAFCIQKKSQVKLFWNDADLQTDGLLNQGVMVGQAFSAVQGAEQYAALQMQKNFAESFPSNALEKLWVWPSEPTWYGKVRREYVNRYINA